MIRRVPLRLAVQALLPGNTVAWRILDSLSSPTNKAGALVVVWPPTKGSVVSVMAATCACVLLLLLLLLLLDRSSKAALSSVSPLIGHVTLPEIVICGGAVSCAKNNLMLQFSLSQQNRTVTLGRTACKGRCGTN